MVVTHFALFSHFFLYTHSKPRVPSCLARCTGRRSEGTWSFEGRDDGEKEGERVCMCV